VQIQEPEHQMTWFTRRAVVAGSRDDEGRNIVIRLTDISPRGRFRYSLSQVWKVGSETLSVVMLNLSTADAEGGRPDIPLLHRIFERDPSFVKA
jgi:hypothetical protein